MVEPTHLEKKKSIGMIILNIWDNKKMFQTTNQLSITHENLHVCLIAINGLVHRLSRLEKQAVTSIALG